MIDKSEIKLSKGGLALLIILFLVLGTIYVLTFFVIRLLFLNFLAGIFFVSGLFTGIGMAFFGDQYAEILRPSRRYEEKLELISNNKKSFTKRTIILFVILTVCSFCYLIYAIIDLVRIDDKILGILSLSIIAFSFVIFFLSIFARKKEFKNLDSNENKKEKNNVIYDEFQIDENEFKIDEDNYKEKEK